VAKVSAAAAARKRRHLFRREAQRIWGATANPDAPGLLERGREFESSGVEQFDPLVVDAIVRLARLSHAVAEGLRDHPDAEVRRSAAVLAARGHPVLAALAGG
jgi:hypothetical protein